MQSSAVVPGLDPDEDGLACLGSGGEAVSVHEFSFQGRRKTTPRWRCPSRSRCARVNGGCPVRGSAGRTGHWCTDPPVAVEDDSGDVTTASGYRGVQAVGDEAGAQVAGHGIAQHPARAGIEDGGQVQPALVGGDVGDVAGPALVRDPGCEVPPGQVRGGFRLVCGNCGAHPLTRVDTDEVVDAHQPFHALVVDHPASVAQFGMHPG
ncbi:hypothetical protein JOF55_003784 [Haloactinomyces albus]|uniref:Uncharacterized protein n=1 Tax=Haloactinomyces albus TaxID=1352928 RepID=A0AAE3ZER7_9ACTN|nr:hypothetical protein [Haloactinomyces albus]